MVSFSKEYGYVLGQIGCNPDVTTSAQSSSIIKAKMQVREMKVCLTPSFFGLIRINFFKFDSSTPTCLVAR